MALTPFPIEGFGGLSLAADQFEVGAAGATSISNADVDVFGAVRTRPGRAYESGLDTTTFSGTTVVRAINNDSATTDDHVLVASPTKIASYKAGNVNTASVTSTFGAIDLLPKTTTTDYVLDDTGLRVWDSVGHTLAAAIAGTPTNGGYLAYAPLSGRLVIASGIRVNFSDPFSTTFAASNFVDVGTNQESITGATALGDLVIVFAETVAFVFYGESTDADGGVIFNYKSVNLGDRICRRTSASGNLSRPGRFGADGHNVYFVGSRGVYAFNGSPPALISDAITPVFRDEVTSIATGLGQDAAASVCATSDRLYVGTGEGTMSGILVFDKAASTWTFYTGASSAMAPVSSLRSVYTVTDSTPRLALLSPASTTDLGNAISWSYKSGRYAVADAGRVAIVPETSLVGSGTVTLRLDSDLYTNQSAAATLGTAPATAEGWPSPVDQEGTWLQYTLSGSGVATMNRLTHHVSSVKPGGVR